MTTYSRISARRGSKVDLLARFLQGGQLADPYAIYRVEIYKGCVTPENIVDIIDIESPDSSIYPSPLVHGSDPGVFSLVWDAPPDAAVPNVYFDVWYFWGTDPRTTGVVPVSPAGSSTPALADYASAILNIHNRFWVYPDEWFIDSGLQTVNFGFEPLTQKFRKSEKRPLEVGLMPLPLYDYDFNLVTPLLPYIKAAITIKTESHEPVVLAAPMEIKLRQGSYRSNPFVVSYMLDTKNLFIGTYQYRIQLSLPDGSTRVSPDYFLTVA